MLEISNVKVYGLEESIVSSGLPMMIQPFTEDEFEYKIDKLKGIYGEDVRNAQSDIKRSVNLGNTPIGSGHSNFLKGIIVQFDLKYPEYISPQLQRYHWFEIVSSQSKIHRLTKMDINNSVNKYVDDIVVDNLNKWVEIYNSFNGAKYVHIADGKLEQLRYFDEEDGTEINYKGKFFTKYEIFMKIISNCPAGLEKTMRITTNYLQLKTIYSQRKTHKLKEDYKALCDFIEELPNFKELCLGDNNE